MGFKISFVSYYILSFQIVFYIFVIISGSYTIDVFVRWVCQALAGKNMKIIRQCAPPGEKTYNATCRVCMTEIEFKQSEANAGSSSRESWLEVQCPVFQNMMIKDV